MIISHLAFSPKRALLRMISFIFAGIMLFWFFLQNFQNSSSREYIFLIDNSLSMWVQDIASLSQKNYISRLDSAKNFIYNFVEKNSKSGIIAFSDKISLISPITDNSLQIKNSLSGISVIRFGGWSDVYKAVSTVSEIYKTHKNLEIIVFTDAEFFDKNSWDFAPKNNIKITFVGVGTEKWWLMLVDYDSNGKPIYKQFHNQNVISSLSVIWLSELANYFSADFYIIDSEKQISEISEKIFAKNSTSSSPQFFFIFPVVLLIFASIFPIFVSNKKIWK